MNTMYTKEYPLEIPMLQTSLYGKDDLIKESNHTIRIMGRTLSRFGLCFVPNGSQCRKVCGGPLVPGPWAFHYQLCTVMASNPKYGSGEVSKERVAKGLEHWVSLGDHIKINNLVYRIDACSLNKDDITLILVK